MGRSVQDCSATNLTSLDYLGASGSTVKFLHFDIQSTEQLCNMITGHRHALYKGL